VALNAGCELHARCHAFLPYSIEWVLGWSAVVLRALTVQCTVFFV
jgi:hypothetical protein